MPVNSELSTSASLPVIAISGKWGWGGERGGGRREGDNEDHQDGFYARKTAISSYVQERQAG